MDVMDGKHYVVNPYHTKRTFCGCLTCLYELLFIGKWYENYLYVSYQYELLIAKWYENYVYVCVCVF